MAHTPQTKGFLSGILSGINQGLNNLVGRGGPNLEDDSSVESIGGDESRAENSSSNDKNVDVDSGDDSNVNISATSLVESPSLTQRSTMVDPKKRAAAKQPQKRRKKKSNNTQRRALPTNTNTEPSHDPPIRRPVNPMRMAEAFTNGYDSDGWEGPPTGTNAEELEAVDVEELPEGVDGADEVNTEEALADEEENEPRHINIAEEDLLQMKVADLKLQLSIRNVGLPKRKNKDSDN